MFLLLQFPINTVNVSPIKVIVCEWKNTDHDLAVKGDSNHQSQEQSLV